MYSSDTTHSLQRCLHGGEVLCFLQTSPQPRKRMCGDQTGNAVSVE